MTLNGYRSKSPWHANNRLYHSRQAYEDLPKPIKTMYTEDEYLWLSDAEKVSLIERECLPEVGED